MNPPSACVSGRRGYATPLALVMLAAVAGLAAASLHAVAEARRAAIRTARYEEAAGSVDGALRLAIGSWELAKRDSMRPGDTDSSTAVLPRSDSSSAWVFVTRLTDRLFLLATAARVGIGSRAEAARAHQLLVEVLRPTFPTAAALTARGGVLAVRDATISGGDSPPPGWTDCAAADTAGGAAVIVPEGVAARFDDGGPIPSAHTDPAAADLATYRVLGRVAASRLAARADLTVAAGAIVSPAPDARTDCRTGDSPEAPQSWGEPRRTGQSRGCEQFFPVINGLGDLVVTQGRGQGVLVVNGRLRIQGPFLFHGVVLANGGIDATGPDVTIYGAVLSAATDAVAWRAAGEIHRSTCAVARVSEHAGRPYIVPHRGWAELF